MTTIAKCQAKNPALCTDPQCPERRGYRHGMATARTYDEYASARNLKAADDARRNLTPQSLYPKPTPKTVQAQAPKPMKLPVIKEYTKEGDPVVKFHKDLGFPKGYNPPSGERQLVYSAHAKTEASRDRYGNIPSFDKINLNDMDLVELKINARTKQVYKLLYRGNLDAERDVCLVLRPVGNGKMVVVTQWINELSDKHRSLRKEEYVQVV